MNTLRILKGNDIELFVDDELLFFVTSFVAQQNAEVYKIEEFLCDEAFDTVPLNKSYELILCTLMHQSAKVFDKESFSLSVHDGNKKYEYLNCRLKSKEQEILPNKPIIDKYTIVATKMNVVEV